MRAATLTEIASILQPARRVLCICHVSPDGDAIGSLLGLNWLLQATSLPGSAERAGRLRRSRVGRIVALACPDPIPHQYRFLPGADQVTSSPPSEAWDAVVTLDASDPRRLGDAYRPEEYGQAPTINLDHHVTNLLFGTLNYVDPAAVATAEIVIDLADALETPIGQEAAVCLLTGLVTDTLGFRTSHTSPRALRLAARLMDAGADISTIAEVTLHFKAVSTMRLWGLALADVQLEGRVVWARVTRAMRERAGVSDTNEGGLSSFLIATADADLAAVFTETAKGEIEIGFRSRPGFDVAALALALGGGGHPQASGCTIAGPLSAAEARVVPMLLAISDGEAPENGL